MTDDPDHEQDEAPRTDDGLGLARDVTRATAGSTPASRKRRRDDRIPDRRTGPQANRKLGGFSGSHPDERDPKPLEGELSRLVGERGWAVPLRMRGVFARWPELVGPEVADHCTPESFTDGTLVVRTDSTAWATQLKLLAPAVVRRLNEDLGHGTVTLLEVVGPHLPNWKKGPRSTRDGRGPRDTYG